MNVNNVRVSADFKRNVRKLDNSLRDKLDKQIDKILEDPEIGKPLRYDMKGERMVYVKPYRLIYKIEGDTLVLLQFEHRKDVYR